MRPTTSSRFLPDPRDTEVKPEDIPLDIVFEDDHFAGGEQSRPAWWCTPPSKTGRHPGKCVGRFQNLLRCPATREARRLVHPHRQGHLRPVGHCQNRTGHYRAGTAVFDHTIDRTYWALVWGVSGNPRRVDKRKRGRSLRTGGDHGFSPGRQWPHGHHPLQTLKTLRYVSLIECKLETGHTHQIRAHLQYLGIDL